MPQLHHAPKLLDSIKELLQVTYLKRCLLWTHYWDRLSLIPHSFPVLSAEAGVRPVPFNNARAERVGIVTVYVCALHVTASLPVNVPDHMQWCAGECKVQSPEQGGA